MERPAKERLIGAIVIVTVAWLLIPVFLDEGAGDSDAVVSRELALPDAGDEGGAPMRRETVSLTNDEDPVPVETAPETPPVTALPLPESTDTQTAEAEDAVDAPAAAAPEPTTPTPSEPVAEREAETQAPQPAEVASSETATPGTPPAEPASGDGQMWAVQVGSFSDRDNAQRLAGSLREKGLLAFLSQVDSGGRTMHRVRVGPQASRDAAAAVVAQLAADGQKATVVPHP